MRTDAHQNFMLVPYSNISIASYIAEPEHGWAARKSAAGISGSFNLLAIRL